MSAWRSVRKVLLVYFELKCLLKRKTLDKPILFGFSYSTQRTSLCYFCTVSRRTLVCSAMAVAASKWKYKLSYEQYCGGVIAIGRKYLNF